MIFQKVNAKVFLEISPKTILYFNIIVSSVNPGVVCAVNKPILSQIPIVLNKEPEYTDQGTAVCEADGKQRYRCGFRIGGGIDQDPSKSPQGYPDKVSTNRSIDVVSSVCVIQCGHHPRSRGRFVCLSVCLSGRITQKLALRSIFFTREVLEVLLTWLGPPLR